MDEPSTHESTEWKQTTSALSAKAAESSSDAGLTQITTHTDKLTLAATEDPDTTADAETDDPELIAGERLHACLKIWANDLEINRQTYRDEVIAVLAGRDTVSDSERNRLDALRKSLGVTVDQHIKYLAQQGWSLNEFIDGAKAGDDDDDIIL